MASLTLSAGELDARRLDPATLAAGVASLQADGYVLIANAVPLPKLRNVAERLTRDTPTVLELARQQHGHIPSVYTYGNLQQDPPFALVDGCCEEILASPWAVQIAAAAAAAAAPAGSESSGRFAPSFTGNTNCPGSRTQPVHRDCAHQRAPLTTFVINICPCDTSLVNGAIELWPTSENPSILFYCEFLLQWPLFQ